MIRILYQVNHQYSYEITNPIKNHYISNHKKIGLYSSLEESKEAIKRHKSLPGFSKYPVNCFSILEFKIDQCYVPAHLITIGN